MLLHFLPEEYTASFMIFVFLGLAQVIDTGVGVNGYIMVNSKYYRVDAILSIFLLIITVTSNLILIPYFGILGAALATAVSIFIYNILRLIYLKIRMGLFPFTRGNLIAFILFLFAGTIAWIIPESNYLWANSFLKTIVFIGITLSGMFYFRFSPELNNIIRSGINLLLRK